MIDPPAVAATHEPAWIRRIVIAIGVAFVGLFVVVPVIAVFGEAFRQGIAAYGRAIADPAALSAVKLTFLAASIAMPLNVVFGVAASWAIARFRFPGRSILITLIDLPLAVSPVIAGMVFVLLFGKQGLIGPWLSAHGVKVIFALPGIVLATTFVTFPFVARELIPLMEAQGAEEEEASIVLGASGWQTFLRVTLPKIKWGLLYGVVLCTARAMGEFGAVSVVSGHIRGRTNTLPLHVEILYNEYEYQAAFAVASLLVVLAFVSLVARRFLGHVNVLDAELTQGHAKIGDVTVPIGEHSGDSRGRVYVRPHEIDIARSPSTAAFAARVVRVTPLSGGLKIELSVPSIGSRIRADIDWERGTALALRDGDDVFLSLRRARVFAHDGPGGPP